MSETLPPDALERANAFLATRRRPPVIAAPVRLADAYDERRIGWTPLHPVATAAGLPAGERRILLLAADDIRGLGYPVWSLVGITGWNEDHVIRLAAALRRRGLVTPTEMQADRYMRVHVTRAGRELARLMLSWRIH